MTIPYFSDHFSSSMCVNMGLQFSYCLSPDGSVLVSGSYDRTISIWDLTTGDLTKKWMVKDLTGIPDSDRIYCLTMSSDGEYLVSGGSLIQAWQLSSGKKIRTFRGGGWANSAALSPDMAVLATEFDDLVLWNYQTAKKIHRLPTTICAPLIITSDSQYLVSADYALTKTRPEEMWERKLKVWDLKTGNVLRILEDDNNQTNIHGLSLGAGDTLLAGTQAGSITIWDFQSGQQIQRISKANNVRLSKHLDMLYSVIFSPNGSTLLTTGSDALIQEWDTKSGEHLGTIRGRNRILRISMSKDARVLVGVGNDGGKEMIMEKWSREGD